MFNLGPAEIVFILLIALLVLGPTRLPELARGLGKFFYEFRKQTDEVRGLVEREFYKMDEHARGAPPVARPSPEGAVARRPPVPPQPIPPELSPPGVAATHIEPTSSSDPVHGMPPVSTVEGSGEGPGQDTKPDEPGSDR